MTWLPQAPGGGDGHPDVLVESTEYPRPALGWWALRAWHIVPMYLRVEFHGGVTSPSDAQATTRMVGTFQHPDRAYTMEVTRQLLAGERTAWLSATDSRRWLKRIPLYVETCRWGSGNVNTLPDFDNSQSPLGVRIYGYALWAWDEKHQAVMRQEHIPSDIFRATWHPAPHPSPHL